ncbi:Fcf2 domain-containing protein [Sporobolomyces koalae]|uniref:Fcf2 domain-containing protein n=1 Tax=Sporobolomyces koalae TaxID=500713 RepID=UPI003173BAD1
MAYSVSPNLPSTALPTGSEPRGAETASLSSTLVESSDSPSQRSLASSSSSSGASSSDDSDDSDDEDEEDDSESEPEDQQSILLQQLLLKAKQAARDREVERKNAAKQGGNDDSLAGNEGMVLFGEEDDEDDREDEEDDDEHAQSGTPKASSSKSTLVAPSLVRPVSSSSTTATTSANAKGKARAGPISLSQDLSGILDSSRSGVTVVGGRTKDEPSNREGEKWGLAPVPRLSKKQYKANQPHTAGSKWFDMPATPMTPELKRELDAMRLRNALDPKKFLKGGAKNDKVGEFFQVGHVITPNSRATTSSSLPTASKRSFVEELVEDEQARAYAKRKTQEVMRKGMSGRKRQRQGPKGSYAMGLSGGKDGKGQSGGSNKRKR